MKLAAIVNYWTDSIDLIEHFILSAKKWADIIIVVNSVESNYGEKVSDDNMFWMVGFEKNVRIKNFYPLISKSPSENETDKRNYGLFIARELGCTHFVTCDTDEFYNEEDVNRAKEMFDSPTLNGLVVPCQTYFAHPWLTIGFDTTLVPFIHKLNADTKHEFNRKYPFAWIDGKIRIDPTRSLNYTSGIIHTESVVMHHYSWIRSDFRLKIRNSTARANIERSTILQDLESAKEGYFCQFYGKTLVRTDVDFGIPDLSARDVTENLQSLNEAEDKPGAS